jgi:hypothetical protein
MKSVVPILHLLALLASLGIGVGDTATQLGISGGPGANSTDLALNNTNLNNTSAPRRRRHRRHRKRFNGVDLLALYSGFDTNGTKRKSDFYIPKPSLAAVFDTKKIHAYFLLGGNRDRAEGCLKVVKSFGLESRHYDFISGPTKLTDDEIFALHKDWSLANFENSTLQEQTGSLLVQLGILRVMNAFLASEHEEMILFKDNVAVPGMFDLFDAVEYARLMLSIPTEEYDMQYLGYCYECMRPVDEIRLGFHSGKPFYYTQALMPLCNHAVLLKRKAVKVFMELTTPFNRPGDISLAHATCSTGMMIVRHII